MKIAVITGASSGMGREMAVQIADRFGGIQEIWLIARRKERLEELEGNLPVKLRCFGMDLTCKEERDALGQALKKKRPNVKFLVNSAGFGKMGKIGNMDVEEECNMIRLNCEALCAITNLVLPYMGKNSRIIQFASAAAFLPQPGFGIYAASKSFVLSYSRALGAELKNRGITVTAVCPGPVDTEFFDRAGSMDQIPFYKKLVMAKPRRVVEKALWDSVKGKAVSVYGIAMKGVWILSKILPHSLLIYLMR